MAKRTLQTLAVVAPFYNEEAGICAFYEQVSAQLKKLPIQYNFVFVDDGSRDHTLERLNEIADHDPSVTVLSLARNFGHQAALTAGLDYAEAEAIVCMDSDLQHPPETILDMIDAYEAGADVVYGVRQQANVEPFKRLASSGYYALLERIAHVTVVRGAADFRLMSYAAVAALREMKETHRYLRGMVPWMGFNSTSVYYDQRDRFAGKPSYTWRKSLRLAHHGLFSFSTVPLELITWLGFLITAFSGVYLVFVLIMSALGYVIPGWTSLIAAVLVLGGIQLIALGVIAQYIGMIFEQVKQRPLYVLKQQRLVQSHETIRLRNEVKLPQSDTVLKEAVNESLPSL